MPDDDDLDERDFIFACDRNEKAADKKLKDSDTIVVGGFGCGLKVQDDALTVLPGQAYKDQVVKPPHKLYRAVHGIKRIVILSSQGFLTLAALQWTAEQNIAVLVINEHAQLLLSIPSDQDPDAKLRRAQYRAGDNGQAASIVSELLHVRISQQLAMLRKLPDHTIIEKRLVLTAGQKIIVKENGRQVPGPFIWEPFEVALTKISTLNDTSSMMQYEATLSNLYWSAFVGIPIRWLKTDRRRIPPHWKSISPRLSPLSPYHNAMRAINPFHSTLNFAYALLQGQCKLALLAYGFDTSCGVLHSDKLNRDSLAFDLMEAHRTMVDDLTLQLFTTRKLAKGDFIVLPTGECRLNPEFARLVATTCRLPQKVIDASARWLRTLFLDRGICRADKTIS
jgi:CRISP-associated protein Cas1